MKSDSQSGSSDKSLAHEPSSFGAEHQTEVFQDAPAGDGQSSRGHVTRLMMRRTNSGTGNEELELDTDVLSRVETLARTLSSHRMRDGPFQVDPDNFDAKQIIGSFVRSSEEQGIHLRKAGVVAEDFTVVGKDCSSAEGQTFEDILLLPRTIIRGIREAKNGKTRDIVRNGNLLARPGEMILVLGRPGAGCSSLLKTICGETSKFEEVRGSITYDGIPQKEMMKKYKFDVVYNGEIDVHFPHLTVQQTLDFALSCTTPKVRVDGMSRSEYITAMRELYGTIFGLRHTYNTKVGNDFVRGVSGGERKRVSIAEALAARGSIYCWDNATRGLDASTALEFAQAIRLMTNLQKSVAMVTIYQASENIYCCFDKVTILYEGRQIYFGETEDAKTYFEKLGYRCPARQSTPEFLTALTDPRGLHEYVPGFENKVPRSADEFEKCWIESPEFQQMKKDIQTYKQETEGEKTQELFDKSLAQEKSKFSRSKSAYTISFMEQVKLCTRRGFQRIYGDKAFTVTNVIASTIQGLVTGSLYYNTPSGVSGAFSRGGIYYFSILYASLMGLAKISLESRSIMEKHKTYSLYHPAAEAFASSASEFPFRFLSQTVFYILLFFLSGLTRNAGRFFTSFLFLIVCAEAINALFDMITAFSASVSQANSICGVTLMALILYSTYMIQLKAMHPWFKWISYVMPIRYSFESMLNSEFHGREMDCSGNVIPSGPSYASTSTSNQVCAFIGSRPGQSYVLGDDYLEGKFQYKYSHTWRNLGFVFAFLAFYLFAKCVITELRPPSSGGGDTLVFKKGARRSTHKSDEENTESSVTMSEAKKNLDSGSGASSDGSDIFDTLKSEGVFLWKDVSYIIPYKGTTRKLLDDVSGYCAPGSLTALMGESGAGKTTLLNTLAQRNVGIITGDMLVNGHPIDASFERRTGYVQQQDVHVKEMTVRESFQFAARLRRPQSVSEAEKLEYVEKIIEILGMGDYADALVGDVGYGLNVEQRKKVSIGVELAAKPDLLLFLDEPTSGLDSQSSWAIVQMLRRLAEAGQSILCTIHQPSATLFEQFDRLLLLKKGGQTVYFGPVGKNSQDLLEYFEENGARKCERSENPAEYILEAIGAGATASVKEDWHDIWNRSRHFKKANEEIEGYLNEFKEGGTSNDHDRTISKYATSYSYQFKVVYARTSAIMWRDVEYLMAKMMLHFGAGLFIGFTFWNVGTSYTGLQNTMFAAFLALIISAPAMNQIQARAIASRELFEVRESKSNTFHWIFLLITQYLCELPFQLVFSTIFFVGFYFPLKVHYEAKFAGNFYLNYCIMFQMYFVGLGLMLLYAAPNLASAGVMLSLSLSFLISFCGVVQPASLMPGFWTFMWKVSPYTYFVQNTVGIVLHDKPVICSSDEMSYLNPPAGQTCGEYMKDFLSTASGYIYNPDATENCGYCVFKVGDDYLSQIGASYSNIWRNFGFYWVYIIFNIFGMITLYYIFHVSSFSLKETKLGKAIMGRLKKE